MTTEELTLELVKAATDTRNPRQVCEDAGATVLVVDTESEHAVTLIYETAYDDDDYRATAHIPKWIWGLCQVLTPSVEDYHGDVAVVYR
jgi:hypothetical protein